MPNLLFRAEARSVELVAGRGAEAPLYLGRAVEARFICRYHQLRSFCTGGRPMLSIGNVPMISRSALLTGTRSRPVLLHR